MEKSLLNEIKVILKSLVLSCPEKITIEQLNRDYRDVEGKSIPFRQMGYSNLEQFLRSIPDTLRVFGSGSTAMVCFVANEKSDHIHDMIMRQKKTKSKGRRSRSFHGGSAQKNMIQRGNRFSNKIQQPPTNVGQQLSPFESVNRNHMIKTVQVRNVPHLPQPSLQALYGLPQPNGILLNVQQNYNMLNVAQNQILAQQYEQHVRQVTNLLQNKCHITAPPPPLPRHQIKTVKFFSKTNTSSHNECTEKSSIETKKDSFKNPSIETKNVNNDIKDSKTTSQNPTKISEVEESLLTIPKLSKFINSLMEPSVNGVINKLGNEELSQIVDTKHATEIKQPKGFFDDSTDKVADPDEAVPSFAAKNNVFRFDFPEHTVPSGSKIAPYTIPDDITVDSCIKIFVSEIHNPFKFWFHIHKDNHELDLLMFKIERYYSSLEPEDLRIPITCLTPGQVCAASYNGLWHRAKIVAPPVNTTIKVSFMDYGTVTEVEIAKVKFLLSYFAKLPAQALRGCLSHIKPRALHWSHDATKCFLTLVAELMLHAKVTEIDRVKNIVYMILIDTNGDVDVQINKSLVERRYASYNEEWNAERIEQNNGKRMHHPREDFPT